MALVELEDVSYSYPGGTLAVDRVSLAVAAGESVAVIGQNGAGKTTTVKLMNGLLRPTSGTVRVDGVDTRTRTAAQVARRVGYVFQNPDDQIFNSSVRREIAYGLRRLRLEPAEARRRLGEAADLAGLAGLLDENPHDLPLSVRKFVTIASVLAVDPDAVVLDEPTAGQDRAGLERIAAIAAHLSARGRAVVTITHDMEFVARHFTRVVVMAQRRVVRDGAAATIFGDAAAMTAARLAQRRVPSAVASVTVTSAGSGAGVGVPDSVVASPEDADRGSLDGHGGR
ncbi:energy-coupling factor ABC transporter ATP-binding protein [Georgenia sp. SUBG003]|uniref:energy-coupling factor ABC transporter ATP-binding protein n=1 Tax=Georgenia sp. SUBG003 TaxID=1497974 RepID=UPI003AB8D067